MADASAATRPAPGFDFSPSGIAGFVKRSDLGLAFGIMAILVVLILPLPTWLLDISLAFSLSFSILILMTAVFIRKPLEFSSFPAILLITTMMRLALNLASTRLILAAWQQRHRRGRLCHPGLRQADHAAAISSSA